MESSVDPLGVQKVQRPVRVLWDTAFLQSLILSLVLPLVAAFTCGASVGLIRYQNVPAPLHNVHIQSRLITGFFPLEVHSCFPIEGVDFIKGNDIDGGKIYPAPEVVGSPILQSKPDDLAQRHPDVFPVCIMTRFRPLKQVQDIKLFVMLVRVVVSCSL